jgi:hypothetical protein
MLLMQLAFVLLVLYSTAASTQIQMLWYGYSNAAVSALVALTGTGRRECAVRFADERQGKG